MVKKKQQTNNADIATTEIVAILELSQLPEEFIKKALERLDLLIEITKDMRLQVDILNTVLQEIVHS
ncbi:MAG: hypothetical protein HY867_07050 [Chloroflexi bacterium]|nr:hypothetical protein [Chloroflexota bacterium]